MKSEPAVRARTVQDALKLLAEVEPEAYEQVRRRIPAQSLRAIEGARALGWVPVEHDQHFPTSVLAILGEDAADAFFRRLVAEQLSGPLLGAAWRATVRTLGLSPASLLRAAPMGWPAVYRGFGTLRYAGSTSNAGAVELTGVPAAVLAVEAYPRSFGAFFSGLIDVCDARGFSNVHVEPQRGRITISLDWSIAARA